MDNSEDLRKGFFNIQKYNAEMYDVITIYQGVLSLT